MLRVVSESRTSVTSRAGVLQTSGISVLSPGVQQSLPELSQSCPLAVTEWSHDAFHVSGLIGISFCWLPRGKILS